LERSNLEPVIGKCVCGRRLKDAAVCLYRFHTGRYAFHRCECGAEWTERQTDINPTDPVSSDEVIEVHTRLATFDGSISELLQPHST
jgi:hypothetical protein